MSRARRVSVIVIAGLWLAITSSAAAEEASAESQKILDVSLTSPPPGQPLFGEIELAADVYPPEYADRVEFLVDGQLVGKVEVPPFRLRYDVGQDNRERHLVARAYDPAGGHRETFMVSPAIRVDEEVVAELQQLYVTVTSGARRELDLGADEFTIVDDGDRQELVTFARGDVRLTATILIDSSASMKGDRLRYALRGASAFVDGIKPTDDASILLFSDRLLLSTPFSNDAQALTADFGAIAAAGGTALNDHLYLSLKRLEHEQGRRVVILLSDGIDSHSTLRMKEVVWLARRSRALIYWLCTDPNNDAQRERSSAWKSSNSYKIEYQQLTRTVLESGGRIITLEAIQDAEPAFRDVLRELREQYVLGYYPSVSTGDGSWHRVQVRVRRSGLQIRTRGGYVDY